MTQVKDIQTLLAEVEELQNQLFEANNIIDSIRDGSVDALVLNKDGSPAVYSLESADYTYRVLIEKFGEGALSIADDGLILYCNEYFAKLLGVSANKIVGSYFTSYVDNEVLFQNLRDALMTGSSKGEITLNFDGKKIPVYISLTDLKPSIVATGIIVTDLTEKRKHEEALALYQNQLEIKINELNQINSNLEEFIHVVSHDIKEPVRKILLYSEHLSTNKSDLFQPADLKKLNAVNASALRLNSLVDDLVKYSSNTAAKEMSDVDLNEVLSEVKEDMQVIIEESGSSINYEALPSISGSVIQMRQLFSNLITNAIKYKKQSEKANIEITAEVTNAIDPHDPGKNFYKISVRDNGIGMEQKEMNKIFVMFQRLHMPNEYLGNGIGLAICKKIMEKHNGKIEVESTVNVGSTFLLYFPVKN